MKSNLDDAVRLGLAARRTVLGHDVIIVLCMRSYCRSYKHTRKDIPFQELAFHIIADTQEYNGAPIGVWSGNDDGLWHEIAHIENELAHNYRDREFRNPN